MKRKIIILCVGILPFLFTQCGNVQSNKNSECQPYIDTAAQYLLYYYIDSLPAYLDSALYYNNIAYGKCKWCAPYQRAQIFFLKREFTEGINLLDSMSTENWPMPEMKSIMINQFKAKQALCNSDSILWHQCIDNIISDFDKYFDRNIHLRDSVLSLTKDGIEINAYKYALLAYFYYKMKIEDSCKVFRDIDSLQLITQGDSLFFYNLKKASNGSLSIYFDDKD